MHPTRLVAAISRYPVIYNRDFGSGINEPQHINGQFSNGCTVHSKNRRVFGARWRLCG